MELILAKPYHTVDIRPWYMVARYLYSNSGLKHQWRDVTYYNYTYGETGQVLTTIKKIYQNMITLTYLIPFLKKYEIFSERAYLVFD